MTLNQEDKEKGIFREDRDSGTGNSVLTPAFRSPLCDQSAGAKTTFPMAVAPRHEERGVLTGHSSWRIYFIVADNPFILSLLYKGNKVTCLGIHGVYSQGLV